MARITESMRDELASLAASMREEGENPRSANLPGLIIDWADEIDNIIDGIDGKHVYLWRTESYIDAKTENVLKKIPESTLLEAARLAWDKTKHKPVYKRWFTSRDMDDALRKVISDPSVLPAFISGNQWAPYMRRMVKLGFFEEVELVGSRGGPAGKAYVLRREYERKQ